MKKEESNDWDAEYYSTHARFVHEMGSDLLALLNPKPKEKILDLGCGEGTLTQKLVASGAEVIGVDLSEDMVAKACARGIDARVADVRDLPFDGVFDAVFSNATLHWVRESRLAVHNIAKALKPGGRFVAEFGGEGNVRHIVDAMEVVFARYPEFGAYQPLWYFPGAEEYGRLLEEEGFLVEYVKIIPRPTPIEDISHWLRLFTGGVTAHLSQSQSEQFRQEVREALKPKLYTKKQGWVADYVRIRVKAVKK